MTPEISELVLELRHWVEALRTTTISARSVDEIALINGGCVTDAIEKAADALEATARCSEQRAELSIKPLAWDRGEGNYDGQLVWSSGDPWVFWIVKNPDSDDYVWCENFNIEGFLPASPVRGSYSTLEAAQAAAQIDFDQRIRDALLTGVVSTPSDGGGK